MSDARSGAAELRFSDSVVRYSHAVLKREQHAKRTCHTRMGYVSFGRPSVLLFDLLACYPSQTRPSLSHIEELAGKGRLHANDDDDIVLLVRTPMCDKKF